MGVVAAPLRSLDDDVQFAGRAERLEVQSGLEDFKYKYDAEKGLFKLHKFMPTGTVFPFDFGFLPATEGEDGDPLDALVLMDEPVSVGCLVATRLIGVIEAEQTQDGETKRNDRLVGVAAVSHLHKSIRELRDLDNSLLNDIERFFVAYNEMQDRKFKPLGRYGVARARKVIRAGQKGSEHNNH